MRALAAAVDDRWPAPVSAAFLDFDAPTVAAALAMAEPTIVVPALLTSAYHGRVDLPGVLATAPAPVRLAPVLGPTEPGDEPHPMLIAALRRRLSEVDARCDGLALIAAGTSFAAARAGVDTVAAALAGALRMPCVAGYASAAAPTAAEAVAAVRAAGATRVAVASYFLAPGRLYDAAVASARSAGVVGVAEPLGVTLVDLVLARAAVTLGDALVSAPS